MIDAPPPFRARWPWIGADLQTLRNFLRRPRHVLPAHGPGEKLEIRVADGSGDRLLMIVDRPAIARPDAPAVLLVHGLTGCSESFYMRATAAALLEAGHVVLRLNMRGAGAGFDLARGSYHAGAGADIAAVIATVPPALTTRGLAAVGFSLGGNVLLKYLADSGAASGLVRAASVSAPIDLAAASLRIRSPRNRIYHRYLLGRMMSDAGRRQAALPPAQRATLSTIRDIYDFDDRLVAPLNGFRDAEDYYARCATAGRLAEIETPTLVIHARDDPWIPVAAYEAVPWSRLRHVKPLLADGGGHLGFHGAGDRIAWHDRAIRAFLAPAGQPRSVSAASMAK